MKINTLVIVATILCLPSCATIHELSAPETETSAQTKQVQKQAKQAKQQRQYTKLEAQASAWLGEPVTIESVDKGFIQTDFIAVTKRGKKLSCFYTGYFGLKMSSIVCGGRGNALLDAAGRRY